MGQGSVSEGHRLPLPLSSRPFDIALPSTSKPAFRRDPKSHVYALRSTVSQRVFTNVEKRKECFAQMGLGNPQLKDGYFLEDFLKPFKSNEHWEIPTMSHSIWHFPTSLSHGTL